MLISDFARRAGLSTDTVRYYVRLGLLRPETNGKGGARPYQVFTAEHLLAARIIRTAQSLGMPLKEILAISQQRRAGKMTTERSVQVLRAQLDRLGDQGRRAGGDAGLSAGQDRLAERRRDRPAAGTSERSRSGRREGWTRF
ncbi:MAG: MerR family transcriptional regulator [Caulobacteraceae bacterium]